MNGTKEKAVWVVAALLFVPVLASPAGWPIAVFFAALWLVGTYGLSYVLDLEKRRREGERGFAQTVRKRSREGRE